MPAPIHLVGAEEARQRLMRAADLGQDLALNGGAGEPAELGDELPHRAALPEVAVSRHMGGEIALQPGFVVPMGAGRVARPPLFPVGIGRLHVDELAPEPDPAQSQMRIEPDIRLERAAWNSDLREFQQLPVAANGW